MVQHSRCDGAGDVAPAVSTAGAEPGTCYDSNPAIRNGGDLVGLGPEDEKDYSGDGADAVSAARAESSRANDKWSSADGDGSAGEGAGGAYLPMGADLHMVSVEVLPQYNNVEFRWAE